MIRKVIACFLLLAAQCSANAATPIPVDSQRQLFLDDYLIASMTGVKRTVEQAQKFSGNPVLWPAESWEPPMATVYGSVILRIKLKNARLFALWCR